MEKEKIERRSYVKYAVGAVGAAAAAAVGFAGGYYSAPVKEKIVEKPVEKIVEKPLFGSGKPKEDITAANSIPGFAETIFWDRFVRGVDLAAKALDISVTHLDGAEREEKQVSDVETAAFSMKVDLLEACPITSGISKPIIDYCEKAGVYFSSFANIPAELFPPYDYAHYAVCVPENADFQGYFAADKICSAIGGKGNIVAIHGVLGGYSAEHRRLGLYACLKEKYPDVKLIAEAPAQYRRDLGLKVMEDFLAANPKIDAVWAANDDSAIGAIEAMKAAGRLAPIASIDAIPDAIDAIIKREMLATLDQRQWLISGYGLTAAYDALHGYMPSYRVLPEAFEIIDSPEKAQDFKNRGGIPDYATKDDFWRKISLAYGRW